MRWFVILLAASALLPGCVSLDSLTGDESPQEAPSCPTESQKLAAWNAGQDFETGLGDQPLTMRLEGTLEGEVDTIQIYLDPEHQALRMDSSDGDLRRVGPVYSIRSDEGAFQGRDHNPATGYEAFLAELDEDEAPSFLDDLVLEDYTVTCLTRGGTELLEFRYEQDGYLDVSHVEANAPYRVVSGQVTDPQLQDNFRVSVAYGRPLIIVDADARRVPLTLELEADNAFMNERGGLYMDATFKGGSEWAPFEELAFHLVDSGDGTVYASDRLADGAWDLGDGDYFEFRDKDDNGLLSEGDEMILDLGPGLDISFWDDWAGAYAVL